MSPQPAVQKSNLGRFYDGRLPAKVQAWPATPLMSLWKDATARKKPEIFLLGSSSELKAEPADSPTSPFPDDSVKIGDAPQCHGLRKAPQVVCELVESPLIESRAKFNDLRAEPEARGVSDQTANTASLRENAAHLRSLYRGLGGQDPRRARGPAIPDDRLGAA